jgi:hypothetical protein
MGISKPLGQRQEHPGVVGMRRLGLEQRCSRTNMRDLTQILLAVFLIELESGVEYSVQLFP